MRNHCCSSWAFWKRVAPSAVTLAASRSISLLSEDGTSVKVPATLPAPETASFMAWAS